MPSSKAWLRAIARQYDKVILVAVAIGLVVSLLYLVGRLRSAHDVLNETTAALDELVPAHPDARAVETAPYQRAMAKIHAAAPSTNRTSAFTPEARVTCADCGMPIPIEIVKARRPGPFCGALPPPVPPDLDEDGDGMWDSWEREHGLDPENSADAALDPDGDGFTNLEEFGFRTDPRAADRLPLEQTLHVADMVATPFGLVFTSVATLPGGIQQFAVRTADGATHFVKLGQSVEGFTVDAYHPKTVKSSRMGTEIDIDESQLTLSKEGREVVLTKGERTVDVQAELLFSLDEATWRVRTEDSFQLRGRAYEVTNIDPTPKRVTIRLADSDQVWTLGPE